MGNLVELGGLDQEKLVWGLHWGWIHFLYIVGWDGRFLALGICKVYLMRWYDESRYL